MAKSLSIAKERTLEVMKDGEVIYSAKPKANGTLQENLAEWQDRLAGIKKGMPASDWSMTVCDMWQDEEGKVHTQLIDVESGKLQIDEVC